MRRSPDSVLSPEDTLHEPATRISPSASRSRSGVGFDSDPFTPRHSDVAQLSSVLAGRYQLTSLLGTGGMGSVFRAHDLELDEAIALKVLSLESIDSEEAIERFKAEVKLARRVTHPNVARTYDFGSDGARCFITMELVDGVSLAERLHAPMRLNVTEVLEITLGILHGLQAAHRASVLHRDLKPGNIMLARDGRVMLMDFGIARALCQDGGDRRTKSNLLGTPLYMSPEQVEGRQTLDARSDLYSLGLIVHEMLTGKVPFDGGSPFSIAAARLMHPAPKLEHPHTPGWFSELVDRLLATDRAQRPLDAAATLAEFRDASPDSGSQAPESHAFVEAPVTPLRVAVLLLESPRHAHHVARGLLDELAEALASTPRMQVLMGTPLDDESARDAARRLGAQVTVEAKLLAREEDQFSLKLRLVTSAEGLMVHAASTSGTLSALTRWAHAVATPLARALETNLPQLHRPATDPITLDLYYRGRAEYHKRWRSATATARELLRQAYERAPDDPQVVGSYALVLTRLLDYQTAPESELVRVLVERSSNLGGGRPEAQIAQASLAYQRGDLASVIGLLHTVLERAPQHADALDMLAQIRCAVGPVDDARRGLELVRAVDREVVHTFLDKARMAACEHDWDQVEALLQRAAHEDVPAALPHYWRARLLHAWRADCNFSPELKRAVEVPGVLSDLERTNLAGALNALRPCPAELEVPIPSWLHNALDPRLQWPRAVFEAQVRAELYAAHGRREHVFQELERLEALQSVDLLWLDAVPTFQALHGSARWSSLHHALRSRALGLRDALPNVSGLAARAGRRVA